jgi:cytochrome c oxidase assembly protein subunit 15
MLSAAPRIIMQKLYPHLLSITLLLALTVIVLGAYTRLSDAGLGCPDWPGCYGHTVVPETIDTAQFQRPLETHKAWKEMIHRYAAGTLGILILLIFLLNSLFQKRIRQGFILPTLLLGTVVFQALLGMWTVTHLLSPLIVTAHLLGGFATLALVAWLWLNQHAQRLSSFHTESLAGVRWPGLLALGLLILQISLGGWTSTNYAAVACGTDFPTCLGQWWPAADFARAFSFEWQPGTHYEFGTLENTARTAIQLAHRIGALVVFLYLGGLAVWLAARYRQEIGVIPVLMGLLLVLQVSLGILNVVLALPLPVATSHTLVAALLLLSVIALNHRCQPVRSFSAYD